MALWMSLGVMIGDMILDEGVDSCRPPFLDEMRTNLARGLCFAIVDGYLPTIAYRLNSETENLRAFTIEFGKRG